MVQSGAQRLPVHVCRFAARRWQQPRAENRESTADLTVLYPGTLTI